MAWDDFCQQVWFTKCLHHNLQHLSSLFPESKKFDADSHIWVMHLHESPEKAAVYICSRGWSALKVHLCFCSFILPEVKGFSRQQCLNLFLWLQHEYQPHMLLNHSSLYLMSSISSRLVPADTAQCVPVFVHESVFAPPCSHQLLVLSWSHLWMIMW